MTERIKERTDGNFVIEMFTVGKLGIPSANYATATSAGALEAFMYYSGGLTSISPVFSVSYLPYLGRNTSDKKTIDDILRPIYTADMEKQNLVPIATATWGFTYPLLTKTLPSLFDWSGIKVRVTNPIVIKMIQNMGGDGLPIARGEIYTSITLGTIDGEITSVPSVFASPDPQLYKHIYVINIGMGLWNVVVNKDALADLPAEYRDILLEEAAKVEKWGWDRMVPLDQEEEELLARAETEFGATIHRATEAEMEQLAAMNNFLWDEWAEEKGTQDILKQVRDALGL